MSPEKAALMEALTVERYARNSWWTYSPVTTHEPLPALTVDAATDNDLTCAARRRDLDREMRGHERRGAA